MSCARLVAESVDRQDIQLSGNGMGREGDLIHI